MLRVCLSLACCLAIASAGCSAVVSPDPSRFDAVDAGPVVTLMDSGTVPGSDAGPGPQLDSGTTPPVDGGGPGPVDAPPGCTGAPRCEGDVLVSCAAGVEVREECALAGAYCDEGACQERVCEPGSRQCSVDRRSVLTCDARGASLTEMACTFACDDSSATCLLDPAPDTCTGFETITVGATERFSLCGQSDANTFVGASGSDCPGGSVADVGDVTFALTIPTRGFYVIDLRDVDSTRSIDTVVYLRRVCDDSSTQLACDDDVPCEQSDVPVGSCSDGVQVRQSRIATTLDPGTYYVVADAFDYDSFGCGTVELRVRQPSTP